jgi:hypothetical protein
MITATLRNITKEGDVVSFYVQYSNNEERNYRYKIEDFNKAELDVAIKNEILGFESKNLKFDALKTYLGKTYSVSKDSLIEAKEVK